MWHVSVFAHACFVYYQMMLHFAYKLSRNGIFVEVEMLFSHVMTSPCVCMSVCLSDWLSTCISQKPRPNFTKFSMRVNCGHGSVHLYESTIRCVFLVLWMTSRLHTVGCMARVIGSIECIDIGDMLRHVVKISIICRTGHHIVWLCRRIQWQLISHQGKVWGLRLPCSKIVWSHCTLLFS